MNAENVAYSEDSMLTRITLQDSSRRRHIVAFMHCISSLCVSMLEDKHRFPRRRIKGGFKARRWKKRRRDRASKEGEKGKEVPKAFGAAQMGSPPRSEEEKSAKMGSPPH
ncbi:hypothetical protein ACET3Z_010568 [Daucus carota]